jgi:hypothetical protein
MTTVRMRRDYSLVAVLVAVSALLFGACGSGSSSPSTTLPTIPIATELPWTRAPEVSTSSTIAVTTTTAVDYAKVPVLVRFEPVSPEQQEIIDAMKVLLPIEKEWVSDPRISMDRLREQIVPEGFDGVQEKLTARLAAGRFSIPGDIDRHVIRAVRRVSSTTAEVEVCDVNNAVAYEGRDVSPTTVRIDSSTVTRERHYLLRRTPNGWRYAELTVVSKIVGQDQCAP